MYRARQKQSRGRTPGIPVFIGQKKREIVVILIAFTPGKCIFVPSLRAA